MSKHLKDSISISRDLKIEEDAKDNLRYNEMSLKSITQKFLKEPLTVESVDKKFRQMYESDKRDEEDESTLKTKKKKHHEEKAIFYDIFVKPKENKIKEIIDRRNQKNLSSSVTIPKTRNKTYISNKITVEGKVVGMNININGPKVDYSSLSLINENDRNKNILANKEKLLLTKSFKNSDILQINLSSNLKSNNEIDTSLLNQLLHKKFILTKISSNESKKNYFNQLIQIRPPEGINAVSSSPLMDSKGWAPSIPSLDIEKINTNLKELLTRAKGGIKAGDITKEAHMAFYLGIMNEEQKKYDQALKFYKKFFLSAKLLQDIYGTELALNRIGVLFSNLYDYKQSLYYNEKHKEISTHNLNGFVAYYNCGLCYRILENYDESIQNFETAIKLSEEENDLESYTLCLAQLAISHLFIGNINEFITYSDAFFSKNKSLNHKDMELEMQLLNGYVYNYCGNIDVSKEYYKKSLIRAANISNEDKVRLSLCNIGLIEAERDIKDYIQCVSDNKEWDKISEPETIPVPTFSNKSNKLDTQSKSNEQYKSKESENNQEDNIYQKSDNEELIEEGKKEKNKVYNKFMKNVAGNMKKESERRKEEEKKEKNKGTYNKFMKNVSGNMKKESDRRKEETERKKQEEKKEKNKQTYNKFMKNVAGEMKKESERRNKKEEENEDNIQMVGGGVMDDKRDNEEDNIQMVGGGIMEDKSDNEDNIQMVGGGVMDDKSDNEEDNIQMVGGGVMDDNCDNEEDNIQMVGGGVMDDNCDNEDDVQMVGGGVMDDKSDNEEDNIQMVGGGVMDDNCDNEEDNIQMVGGGVMDDNCDNEEDNNQMVGGGVMDDNDDGKNIQFDEPEEVA